MSVTVVTPGGTSGGQTFTYASPTSNPVVWIGPNTGAWDTASNWSIDAVPDASDSVIIGSGVTVTHSSDDDSVNSLSCAGTLVMSSGSLTLETASSITNLTLSGGTVSLDDDLSVTGDLTQSGGTISVGSNPLTVSVNLDLDGGSFTLGGGTVVATVNVGSGGSFSGHGSITGDVTDYGTLTVGSSTAPGSLSITGNYTQDSGAYLNMILGGLTAGTGYSHLAISGTATLAGTMNVSLMVFDNQEG